MITGRCPCATDITKPYATIILKEKQAWHRQDGNWLKAYAFADSHAETQTSEDGNFDK